MPTKRIGVSGRDKDGALSISKMFKGTIEEQRRAASMYASMFVLTGEPGETMFFKIYDERKGK